MTEGARILEGAQLVEHLLEDRATLFRGRFEDLDRAMGRSRFYFVRMLQDPEKLRLVDVLSAIDALGFHPSEYFRRIDDRYQIFSSIPAQFLETRSVKSRKGSGAYYDLFVWAQHVAPNPNAQPLNLNIDPYLELLGESSLEHRITFGKALLEVIRRTRPSNLTSEAIAGCGATLLALATHHHERKSWGDALDMVSVIFCLSEKIADFDLRAQAYLTAASILKAIGFAKDASWCAYEGTLLSLGLGSFDTVVRGLELYENCQISSLDHMDHLIQVASDERNASSAFVSKKVIDQPLGENRQSFYRLLRGTARNTLTVSSWQRFAQGLVSKPSLSRAFRVPFVPKPGAQLLETCLASYNGNCPEEYRQYLTWLTHVELLGTPEPNVVFPSVAEAQETLAACTFPEEISRRDAFSHATACAVVGHHLRMIGDHQGSYELFKAVLAFEARLDSLPLRSHLVRLSAYLLRDTGNLNEARIWAYRSLQCALAKRDPYSLAQASYTVATLHMLFNQHHESVWLLRGSLKLSKPSSTFASSAHVAIASCLIKLDKLKEAREHIRHAESLDIPGTYAYSLGLRGIICSREGRKREADTWFEASHEAFEELGYSLDRLVIGLYSVAHAIRFGDLNRAQVEIENMEKMAHAFPCNKLVRATVFEVYRKNRQGHLTLQLLDYACRQVECPWQKIS